MGHHFLTPFISTGITCSLFSWYLGTVLFLYVLGPYSPSMFTRLRFNTSTYCLPIQHFLLLFSPPTPHLPWCLLAWILSLCCLGGIVWCVSFIPIIRGSDLLSLASPSFSPVLCPISALLIPKSWPTHHVTWDYWPHHWDLLPRGYQKRLDTTW